MRDEPPEAQRRVGALRGRGVQRDERGHGRRAAGWINQQELMIGPVVSDHDVRAVVGIAPDDCRWENPLTKLMVSQRWSGRGRQDDDRRQFLGPPENR